MYYKYYINLDERGEFYADIREDGGKTVFEIADADHMWEPIEDGWMDGWMVSGTFTGCVNI